MEIKGKDGYRIELNHMLSLAQIKSLMLCYQSIIGPTAVTLYLTLVNEAENQRGFEAHTRLCALMGIDIVAFELARGKCEEVNLIQTWYEKNDTRENYIYALKAPLTVEQFLSHDVLGRRYIQVVGGKMAEVTQTKAVRPIIEKEGFRNISKRFGAHVLQSWTKDDEVKFNKVKPNATYKTMQESYISFDYDAFLAESTNLSFPIEARTHEALEVIGQLATLYGITPNRMRILVGHSINNSTNVLDIQKLKNLASYEKPKEEKSKNPYDVSPVYFLQNLQKGIPVARSEAKMLEFLISDMKMKHEVVNVLVEYVLNNNDNRLSKGYVEKVAGTWVRNQIDSLDKALAAIKETTQSRKESTPVRKTLLPKNFEQREVAVDEKMNEEELKLLKERLKRLEG